MIRSMWVNEHRAHLDSSRARLVGLSVVIMKLLSDYQSASIAILSIMPEHRKEPIAVPRKMASPAVRG